MCGGGGGCGSIIGAALGVGALFALGPGGLGLFGAATGDAAANAIGGVALSSIGTAATVGGTVGGMLLPSKTSSAGSINLPSPAAPAPVTAPNGGASVRIGTNDAMTSRVTTGSGTGGNVDNSSDVMSGLGRSGLMI